MMIRIAYKLDIYESILSSIHSHFTNSSTSISPLDKFPQDIYFVEIQSILDIDALVPIKNQNINSIWVLLGPENIELIKYGYCLEPFAYISSLSSFDEIVQKVERTA